MEASDINEAFSLKEKKYRRIIAILSIACLLLAAGLVITKVKTRTLIIQTEKVNTMKDALKAELDSLLKEHDKIASQYGNISKSLKTKDSIIQANADEIKNLLAYKYDYNKVKRKLDMLRGFTQTYVRQIDSLLTVNKSLKKENLEIREYLDKEKEKTSSLSREKEDLSQKISQGALLKAYNVTAVGVRSRSGDKEDITEKARRTDKVKVCFTLSENSLAEPGMKTVYVRLVRPDGVVVTEGLQATTFEYNGQQIQYSMKQEVNYQGKAQNICMNWSKKDKKAEAMKGNYKVAVFVDGYEIGSSQFDLK